MLLSARMGRNILKPNSIRKRVIFGYALPLCVATLGLTLGLAIGRYQSTQALKSQEAAIAERKRIDEIRGKLLSYNLTQSFSGRLGNEATFTAEIDRLLRLLAEVRVLLSQHEEMFLLDGTHHQASAIANSAKPAHANVPSLNSHRATEEGDQLMAGVHESMHQAFEDLEIAIDGFDQRTQRFANQVHQSFGQLDHRERSQLAFILWVQSSEYNRLLNAIAQLSSFLEYAELREKAAEADLQNAFRLQTLMILGSLLISLLLATLIARKTSAAIARPIVAVTDVACRVVEENDFSLRAPICSRDEVSILARALNRLIEQVKQLLDKVERKNTDLSEAFTRLEEQQIQLVQSEKMSSLGQLVAGIAHEINNPVNFIHGNIAYVKEHVDDVMWMIDELRAHHPEAISSVEEAHDELDLDFVQEDLGKILTSMRVGTERIRGIVLSLRNFSRLDEADYKAVDLHEGIDSSLLIVQHRLKATPYRPDIEVIRDYGDLPQIQCYSGQLNQVILNLLTNAIDAIEERYLGTLDYPENTPPSITIKTQRWRGESVEIAIQDMGTGMSEEVQQRLFEKFFTTKPVGIGTGIGLAISHQIITESHGGQLTFDSTPGKGSTFFIRIPMQQALASAA